MFRDQAALQYNRGLAPFGCRPVECHATCAWNFAAALLIQAATSIPVDACTAMGA